MHHAARSARLLIVAFIALTPATLQAQPPPAAPGEPPAAPGEPPPAPAPAPEEPAPTSEAPAPAEAAPSPAQQEPVEVVVVGSRLSRVAGSAHVINRQSLERFEYDDPHQVLLQVPGVYVRQEDGVGLRPNLGLRGGNPDRSKKLTLMEDGVLFGPAPYSAPAAYYFPLMTRMSQVRVIKGPSAVAYGPQTVGGAVDFVTRPIPSLPSASFDLALGQYGYDKLEAFAGTSTEQVGYLVEFTRVHNRGFKRLPDSDADTGATRTEWMSKASYILDPTSENPQELGVKLTYSEERSNETYLGLTDADFRVDPYRRYAASALDQMKNHRFSAVLSHRLEALGQRLKLTSQAYRHNYHRVWRKLNRLSSASLFSVLEAPDEPGNRELIAVLRGEADSLTGSDSLFIGPNDRTFVSQGVQSQLDYAARTGPLDHALSLGLRAHYDSIERRHSEDEYLMSEGRLLPADSPTLVTTANFAQTYALALHALDAVTLGSLTLTPGARLEVIRSELEDRRSGAEGKALDVVALPGVGLYYGVTDHLGLLGGVHRGFSPPPPGDEAAEPEFSINYEAGARASKGPHRLEVIGFLNDYQNLTDICTFSSSCDNQDLDSQFSAGEALTLGLEAFGTYELQAGPVKLPFTAAYTLTRSRFEGTFDSADPIYGSVERGDHVPYVPLHQGSVSVGVESVVAGGAVSGYHVAPMREEAGAEPLDEALTTDTQTWLDASAYIRPIKQLSIYAHLRNVTGAQHIVGRRPYGARPNAPRWLQVGAKWVF